MKGWKSGNHLQVHLPYVGRFVRSKGGRIQFLFGDESAHEFVAKGQTPSLPVDRLSERIFSPGLVDTDQPDAEASLPWHEQLVHLRQLCTAADTDQTGRVVRNVLEGWILEENCAFIEQLPAGTLLKLLHAHAHGMSWLLARLAASLLLVFCLTKNDDRQRIGRLYKITES
jgi:hypothetical protein